MTDYTSKDLLSLLVGLVKNPAVIKNVEITSVSMDSRQVEVGALFITTAKEQQDRQSHIEQAISSGAKAILIDEVAVDVANANVEANNLVGRIIAVEAAGFDHPDLLAKAPYDLVFANILKGPLVALAPEMGGAVKPEGFVILSGILNEQADAVIDVYCANGFNLVQRDSIVDWTTLTLSKKP